MGSYFSRRNLNNIGHALYSWWQGWPWETQDWREIAFCIITCLPSATARGPLFSGFLPSVTSFKLSGIDQVFQWAFIQPFPNKYLLNIHCVRVGWLLQHTILKAEWPTLNQVFFIFQQMFNMWVPGEAVLQGCSPLSGKLRDPGSSHCLTEIPWGHEFSSFRQKMKRHGGLCLGKV